jgi:flagellar hook-associated protein 3 FlgL
MKADTGITAEISDPNDLGLPAGSASTEIDTSQPQTPTLNERFSRNLMQLVLDASSALRRGDQDTVNAIIDRANEANNHILTEITTLGTKSNSIEFYQNKNKDYEFNLKERQNLVEGTDMENEIIEWEAVKAAYDATLKMGTQILPHSIFDFI